MDKISTGLNIYNLVNDYEKVQRYEEAYRVMKDLLDSGDERFLLKIAKYNIEKKIAGSDLDYAKKILRYLITKGNQDALADMIILLSAQATGGDLREAEYLVIKRVESYSEMKYKKEKLYLNSNMADALYSYGKAIYRNENLINDAHKKAMYCMKAAWENGNIYARQFIELRMNEYQLAIYGNDNTPHINYFQLYKEKDKTSVKGLEKRVAEIKFTDVVIVGGYINCIRNSHSVEALRAKIYLVKKDYSIVYVIVPAAYCPTCNKYYILKGDLQGVSLDGELLCNLITDETGSAKVNFGWSEESLLMRMGYNVNQNDNLTIGQRQKILASVLETKIMTKLQICNHLDNQIQLRKNLSNMKKAISKWEADREFVVNYKYGEQRLIEVKYK